MIKTLNIFSLEKIKNIVKSPVKDVKDMTKDMAKDVVSFIYKSEDSDTDTCFRCHKEGHLFHQCREKTDINGKIIKMETF